MNIFYRILEKQYSDGTSVYTPQKAMTSLIITDVHKEISENAWQPLTSPKGTPNLIGESVYNFNTYESAENVIKEDKRTFVYEIKQITHLI